MPVEKVISYTNQSNKTALSRAVTALDSSAQVMRVVLMNPSTQALLTEEANYPRMKVFNYGSGRIKYICKNTNIDANETDTDWLIWKFTDSDEFDREGPRSGAVNTEAVIDGLSWNI